MDRLCESTVWGMASAVDRQILAGAMPFSSAIPSIPIRANVTRSRLSLHRPKGKYGRVTRRVNDGVIFLPERNSGK